MKTRSGFVSNSSTSSFAVPLSLMTADQIAKAKDYHTVAKTMLRKEKPNKKYPYNTGYYYWLDENGQVPVLEDEDGPLPAPGTYLDQSWHVWEEGKFLVGSTYIDNFDFEAFLIRLGVPRDAIKMDSEERFPKP